MRLVPFTYLVVQPGLLSIKRLPYQTSPHPFHNIKSNISKTTSTEKGKKIYIKKSVKLLQEETATRLKSQHSERAKGLFSSNLPYSMSSGGSWGRRKQVRTLFPLSSRISDCSWISGFDCRSNIKIWINIPENHNLTIYITRIGPTNHATISTGNFFAKQCAKEKWKFS